MTNKEFQAWNKFPQLSKIYGYEQGFFRYHLDIIKEKKGKLIKTNKILNIRRKFSNVSVIETEAVKFKVTIKYDMKAMSNIFS